MTILFIYCFLLILTTFSYPCFVVAGQADEYMESVWEYEFREKLKER